MAYTLVLPFHSDLSAIAGTVARARREGGAHDVREVLLAHNGRALSSEEQAQVDALAAPGDEKTPAVRVLDTRAKGIGAGYKLGIAHAREDYVILSADDLPFGWTDLEGFERAGRPDFAIGSKAHPDSRTTSDRGWKRRASTFGFVLMRRLLLGWDTPDDSQGSLILRTSVARALLPELVYDHYLVSLELATLHLMRGGNVVEVPTVLEEAPRVSSISVVRDGIRMTKDLIALRRRVRSAG